MYINIHNYYRVNFEKNLDKVNLKRSLLSILVLYLNSLKFLYFYLLNLKLLAIKKKYIASIIINI